MNRFASSFRFLPGLLFVAAFGLSGLPSIAGAQSPASGQGWTHYGGDAGGMRYSAAGQVTRANVQGLRPVWEFHTHALEKHRFSDETASFESTPILSNGVLYVTSPFDEVFALDARTGQQKWVFDPKALPAASGGLVTNRGVALWESAGAAGLCSRRLFFGTLDARLMAIDADTGLPCAGFGQGGTVDLTKDVYFHPKGFYSVTSAPTIVGNVVVVGSSVGDNQRVDAESGLVRAYDAVTGAQLWAWEPLPWAEGQALRTGAGNVWSTISADPKLGLVYLPTGSASPDFWGGQRLGDNRDADSIVALDAKTGKKIWAFQVVHHDLWDYDIAAQPLLFAFKDGTPAIAVATKMGQVFVFDRRNGHPLFPIEERPVPQSDVPGEATSATQPFSSLPPMGPIALPADREVDGWQRGSSEQRDCRSQLKGLRYEGMYTPPSLRGSILFPGNLGGVNWGSMAFDPASGILYANNNRAAYVGQLIPQHGLFMKWHNDWEPVVRDWPLWIYSALGILALNVLFRLIWKRGKTGKWPVWLPGARGIVVAMVVAAMAAPACFIPHKVYLSHFGYELSPQRETPYQILRKPIVDAKGRPCIAPPWGAMTALNLNTGKIAWESPLGSMVEGQHTGIMNFGGPMVTASGLVFTGAAEDPYLRAFDASNGKELWTGRLPVPAQSTPMTYMLDGKQYVVVAAGGHADHDSFRGDSVVAFALN